jgi:hypothetical protein
VQLGRVLDFEESLAQPERRVPPAQGRAQRVRPGPQLLVLLVSSAQQDQDQVSAPPEPRAQLEFHHAVRQVQPAPLELPVQQVLEV